MTSALRPTSWMERTGTLFSGLQNDFSVFAKPDRDFAGPAPSSR